MTYFLILFLISLNIADVVLTYKILKNGGRELNPFLEPLFKRYNPLVVMITAKLAYLVPFAFFVNIVPVAVLYVLNVMYFVLLIWNAKEYVK